MKTIAVCNPSIKNLMSKDYFFEYEIFGEKVLIGLIEVQEPMYDKYFTNDTVLVRVDAFSCNYREKNKLLLFNKACKSTTGTQKIFYLPFGSEFVGEVLKVGNNVKKLKIGDRVIPDGTFPFKDNGVAGGVPTNYASKRVQLFHSTQLIKIPDSMPNSIAASFTVASQTVYSMIRKLNLSTNSCVLITSATSNTSLTAINVLIKKGIKVFVISSNSNYHEKLSKLGVYKIIPYSIIKENTLNEYIKIKFDAVIDPFFDVYLNHVVKSLNYGGKYITCGYYNQNPQFEKLDFDNDFFDTLTHCIVNNISIIGNCLGEKMDLENAILDYSNNKHTIIVDSIHSGEGIELFIKKTFNDIPRFGKVVYQY